MPPTKTASTWTSTTRFEAAPSGRRCRWRRSTTASPRTWWIASSALVRSGSTSVPAPASAARREWWKRSPCTTTTSTRACPADRRDLRGCASAVLAKGASADPKQRQAALAKRLQPLAVAAVEQTSRGAHGLAQGTVVGLPPEVSGEARLPGDQLYVHALVEAELRVRAAK